ncbi:MAG: Double zinc ribbon [Chloroflexi bacterium OLB15]|nr:MAG: Double zinc ribbon [Chloroflexi bacterium OLB15]
MNNEQLNTLLTVGLVYGGLIAVAFWAGMVVWTFRDMRARSRDTLAQILATVMVAALTLPGFLLYLFLRPKETLAEAYERSLEEEALLQEIEDKPVCPGCRQRVQEDWQACPYCHTRLKKPCTRCGKMLDLAWDICPHCTTPAQVYNGDRQTASSTHARPAAAQQYTAAPEYESRSRQTRRREERLEFVEGEDSP